MPSLVPSLGQVRVRVLYGIYKTLTKVVWNIQNSNKKYKVQKGVREVRKPEELRGAVFKISMTRSWTMNLSLAWPRFRVAWPYLKSHEHHFVLGLFGWSKTAFFLEHNAAASLTGGSMSSPCQFWRTTGTKELIRDCMVKKGKHIELYLVLMIL